VTSRTAPTDDVPAVSSDAGAPDWQVLAAPQVTEKVDRPVRVHLVLLRVGGAILLVVLLVILAGGYVNRRTAESEAVNDAAHTTDSLVTSLVQPDVQNGLVTGDAAAVGRIDRVVRERVLGPSIVRVKVWNLDGRIVYSDEPRLVGQHYSLGTEEREVLTTAPGTRAEVTDLTQPENQFERGRGKLLEVYRPVWTPDGQPLLFETYAPYSLVTERSTRLWRGFAGVTLSSVLLMITLLIPIIIGLLRRVRLAQQQREALLLRAVEASSTERRRIAATLHDGVVQELAATALQLAGKAAAYRRNGQDQAADEWQEAAGTVRANVGGLRSVLVDIYPASLHSAGLSVALSDLANTLRGRTINIDVNVDPSAATGLPEEAENLVFRVAQETMRNSVKHSGGLHVSVTVWRRGNKVVLEVADDGAGFDVSSALDNPEPGHLGLRLLTDLCAEEGATLLVDSGRGRGTRWHLEVYAPPTSGRSASREARTRR
jgi:signal transduction histidine kinase